jgi:hypothetical protein
MKFTRYLSPVMFNISPTHHLLSYMTATQSAPDTGRHKDPLSEHEHNSCINVYTIICTKYVTIYLQANSSSLCVLLLGIDFYKHASSAWSVLSCNEYVENLNSYSQLHHQIIFLKKVRENKYRHDVGIYLPKHVLCPLVAMLLQWIDCATLTAAVTDCRHRVLLLLGGTRDIHKSDHCN